MHLNIYSLPKYFKHFVMYTKIMKYRTWFPFPGNFSQWAGKIDQDTHPYITDCKPSPGSEKLGVMSTHLQVRPLVSEPLAWVLVGTSSSAESTRLLNFLNFLLLKRGTWRLIYLVKRN